MSYTIPALGSPNVPESSSVYMLDIAGGPLPTVSHVVRTGRAVGEVEDGIAAYGASHPNAVVTKRHLSLASIFKTVDLILGLPPLNQYDAAATDLRDIFTSRPDFSPYDFQRPMYVAKAKRSWKKLTHGIDFSTPDGDEVRLRLAIERSEGLPRAKRTLAHARHGQSRVVR